MCDSVMVLGGPDGPMSIIHTYTHMHAHTQRQMCTFTPDDRDAAGCAYGGDGIVVTDNLILCGALHGSGLQGLGLHRDTGHRNTCCTMLYKQAYVYMYVLLVD